MLTISRNPYSFTLGFFHFGILYASRCVKNPKGVEGGTEPDRSDPTPLSTPLMACLMHHSLAI
jgi:hypothetical protein